jgi:hypothetical protein
MERFWAKVEKQESGCWVWQGATRSGYGAIKIDGKVKGTHRVSFEMANGPIPEGLLVCYSCDNPPCVNPDHLWLGTYEDNARDGWKKGRIKVPVGKRYQPGNVPHNKKIMIRVSLDGRRRSWIQRKFLN